MLEPVETYEQLRAAGLRLTPQRRVVVEVLAGDTSHPTAESVAQRVKQRMPGVSLSTVYKVLHELAGHGLVSELDVAGVMRFDPDTDEHMHVVCDGCGTIIDVPIPEEASRLLSGTAASGVSSVSKIDVVVRGLCNSCAA